MTSLSVGSGVSPGDARDGGGGLVPPVVDVGGATHAGKVRAINEDSFMMNPANGVFAVADGMGGHEGGQFASSTVVQFLESIGTPISGEDLLARLEDRMLRANATVRAVGEQRGKIIGSTIAILLLVEDHYACVWSGDSRVYRIREGVISQMTRDHTEVRELLDRGILTEEEARTWPRRHVITRAIGVGADPELEIEQGMTQAGDLFVICSDGLTGHVRDEEILAASAHGTSQTFCDALVRLTLERGASDNVTVVAVRWRGVPPRSSDTVVMVAPASSPGSGGRTWTDGGAP